MKFNYCLLSVLLFPFSGLAADIDTLFPYAAQSHNADGEIEMDEGSKIIGTREMSGTSGYLNFKNKDDDKLKGKCDEEDCKLSYELGPKMTLPAFQPDEVIFPVPFKNTNTSRKLECDKKKDSKNSGYNRFETLKVEKKCEITLTNPSDEFRIKKLEVKEGGVLTLAAGDYWIEDLDIDDGHLVIPDSGVNFYVSNSTEVKNSNITGLHIYTPNNDINLEDVIFTGSLLTNEKLDIDGFDSDVTGRISADKLELEGALTLESGEYHFHEIELKGDEDNSNNYSVLEAQGPVTFYIESELKLDEKSRLGSEDQPMTIYVYGKENRYRDDDDDDGKVELDDNARLYGFVYVEGELDLDEGVGIYGAVNVIELEMDKDSFINNGTQVVTPVANVHHYELHFNSCNADLTVKACGDASCSANNLYSDKATVHVKNQGHSPKNLYKFKNFNGQASTSIAKKAEQLKYYFELGYHTTGNGNLSPKPLNDLVCYVDGVRTCKVNGQSNSSGSGPLTLEVDTAFAADNAPISFSGNCLTSNATVEVEFGFDSSASGFAGPVTIHWPGHVETLNTGQKKPLILPVSGATLSYPRADLLTLSARKVLPEGGYAGDAVTDQVAFVPASWKVQQAVDCGADNGFRYVDHADSCTVLGAAGGAVNFSVAALDVNGSNLPLDWLKGQQGLTQQVEVNLKNGGGETQAGTFGINSQAKTLSQHQFGSKIVGRLGISIPDWTAQYIPGNDSPLVTQGHQAFVGRTVPESLKVIATPGDIEGDVVYAGKSGVIFDTAPSFTVVGLDVNGNELPSYSGEFAGGLKGNTALELDTALDLDVLAPTITEVETGKHVISVDTSQVRFIKTEPFAETELDLPLWLTINDHDGTSGADNEETTLAQESDSLRFGFVTLMDTEVKTGEAGKMFSKLHYYGENLNTLKEDGLTDYTLSFGTLDAKLKDGNSLPDLSLSLNDDKVDVAPYSSEQKDIEVTIEGLPDWLKPEQDGSLIDPEARLDILNQPRRRANDSTFNRREVIR